MIHYLLDTDWVIRTLRGELRTRTTLLRLPQQQIAVSRVTAAELYEGSFRTVNPAAHLASLRYFLAPYHVLDLNDGIAEQFAETRAFLRRQGQMIGDLDTLIAATALHYGLTLLTFNRRHYERVPGLLLYDAQA